MTRHTFFAYAALLLGVIAFASSFVRTTSGQQGALSLAGEGRYHASAAANPGGGIVFVTDSVTGRTWYRHTNINVWNDLGSPVPAK